MFSTVVYFSYFLNLIALFMKHHGNDGDIATNETYFFLFPHFFLPEISGILVFFYPPFLSVTWEEQMIVAFFLKYN